MNLTLIESSQVNHQIIPAQLHNYQEDKGSEKIINLKDIQKHVGHTIMNLVDFTFGEMYTQNSCRKTSWRREKKKKRSWKSEIKYLRKEKL